jgi:hypothetical protein
MNPHAVKLFLTLLWLAAATGLYIASGHVFGLPSLACLCMAAFNFVRWVTTGTHITGRVPFRRHDRNAEETEPNPAFRFDEPPPTDTAGRET